jgi:mRNA degradation ribonuclease J1/J2
MSQRVRAECRLLIPQTLLDIAHASLSRIERSDGLIQPVRALDGLPDETACLISFAEYGKRAQRLAMVSQNTVPRWNIQKIMLVCFQTLPVLLESNSSFGPADDFWRN